MCRVEERVYLGDDGRRQAFEESFLCSKARRGRVCPDVTRKTVEYRSKPPQISRDDDSSPASYNPPTPTGTGTYLVQRQPTGVSRRPSTKEGTRVIKPEIIIEFGSKKDKTKRYPAPSIKTYKRSSLGATSISSNDVAVESPGSEASYTIRTGLPEAPAPPIDPSGYTTRPAVPHGHRHTSSASSFTTSSQPPSLYAASEPESPSTRRAPRYPPTIVHNPPGNLSPFPPASPSTTRSAPAQAGSYRTTVAVPSDSQENVGVDGIFPVDYSQFQDQSISVQATPGRSAAPEITERDAERAHQRKARAEADKKRQEQADFEMAKNLVKDEEAKQVRFELGRAEGRAKERAETSYAYREVRRAEEREEARRQKQKEIDRAKEARRAEEREQEERRRQQEQNERAAREAKRQADKLREDIARKEREVKEAESKLKKEKRHSRPPTRDPVKTHRRRSMSQHDVAERERLIAETKAQMALEREAAERREREEQAALLLQQQQQPQYWDPRGGSRIPVTNDNSTMGRRNSVSRRRGSISAAAPPPPMGIGRRDSTSQRRVSIIQPAPPTNMTAINTTFQNPPPMFSPSSAQPSYSTRPPSARHSSYDAFAQPAPRVSNTSQDNPFAPPGASADPWDARNLREALPRDIAAHPRQPSDDRHTLRRRGEEVIERAAVEVDARQYDRARQATRAIGNVVGYDDYLEEDPRSGRSKGGKRRS